MQVINSNVASLNSQRHLDQSNSALQTSLQRLSSGLRINSAKDDAAGLAISERMSAQIKGMDQARRNANDGVSLAQTGEGALNQMGTMVQRIRELAVQSANASNTASDRAAINSEVTQLVSELDRFAQTTEFNGLALFDGSFSSSTFQVGANANQTITATTGNFRTSKYGTYQVGNNSFAAAAQTVSGGGTLNQASGAVISGGSSNFVINGAGGSATINVTSGSSAKDVATAVNAVSQTGVKATAKTDAILQFSGATSYTLNLTGTNTTQVQVSFTLSSTNTADGLSAAVTAFNDQASKTGITAKLNSTSDALELTAADGSTIYMQSLATGSAATQANISLSGVGATNSGTVVSGNACGIAIGGNLTFDSDKSYNISNATVGFASGAIASTSVASGTLSAASLQSMASLDVSTVANATVALRISDSALQAINSQRAVYGALQSRFENTISNLQTASENLSAARSRIRDADFAAETSSLTRAQILQQAGTAMLAQANSLPQGVLSLLRG